MQPSPQRRNRLPARSRIRRAALFQEAYAQGEKTAGRYVVLWVRRGDEADARLGVVASRKVGNSVARSRAKRRLREWTRQNRHRLLHDADLILVARHAILDAPQAALETDFEQVFSRAGRLQSDSACPTSDISTPAIPPQSHE